MSRRKPAPTPAQILAARVKAAEDFMARTYQYEQEEQERIGLYTRRARESTGKSLRSVAKAMGVSAPFLSDMERGFRRWNHKHIEAWGKAIS